MKTPAAVKPSLTMLDGSTYQKEFPAWVSSFENVSSNFKKDEFKQATSRNENIYYESLKPIFVLLTLAGVLPVFKLKIQNHKLQVILVGGVCLTVYMIFAYLTFLVTRDIVYLMFHDIDFSSVIVQVTVMMLLMQHVVYLVLTWPESLAVNKYLTEWGNFQSHYELVSGSKLVLMCRMKVVLVICMAVLLSAAYPHCIETIDDHSITSNIAYMVLSYHTFILLCFYILWFSNSWAVTEAAQQYNTRLAKEFMLDISAEKLEEYRLVWMKLTEIVRSGSSMLSYTMSVMVTTLFAYEVIAAYNLTMFVIRSIQQGNSGNTQEAIATALTFIFYGSLLYMFCNSGHWMTLKCEQIQDVLLTHKPRLPSAVAKVNNELRLFLRCLRSVPPHATLSGYVIINRKIFLHMTGVLVTYLIILVQFNIGSISQAATTEEAKTTSQVTLTYS